MDYDKYASGSKIDIVQTIKVIIINFTMAAGGCLCQY